MGRWNWKTEGAPGVHGRELVGVVHVDEYPSDDDAQSISSCKSSRRCSCCWVWDRRANVDANTMLAGGCAREAMRVT